ncbi:hypothetical protein PE36_17275 [Moritella sp. PE36]|nr:hypothetical protein PE36_17275 [Moritella sp. PE36]
MAQLLLVTTIWLQVMDGGKVKRSLMPEVKNGNPGPTILYFLAMAAICVFFLVFRGY